MTVAATISGTLPVGIAFAGKNHAEFEIRRARVSDTVDAFDEVGGESPLRLECAQIARQITRLGDVPAKDINTALITGADDLDFETLQAARGLLAKKPLHWPASSIPSWPVTPSPAPATSAAPSSA